MERRLVMERRLCMDEQDSIVYENCPWPGWSLEIDSHDDLVDATPEEFDALIQQWRRRQREKLRSTEEAL